MKKLVLGVSCVLFALACVVVRARAATYVVDPIGGGDYTTIQAALDAVQGHFPADTIVVHAGFYPEHVLLRRPDSPSLITCPSGAASTRVLGVTFAARGATTLGAIWWTVRGLTVDERVVEGYSLGRAKWERCAFSGGFTADYLGSGVTANFSDCDFFVSARLLGLYGPMRDLRFHQAPLVAEPRVGSLFWQRCRFAGAPGETLVIAPRTEDLAFYSCAFDSGAIGVHARNGGFSNFTLDSCRFSDLGAAVHEPAQSPTPAWSGPRAVTIRYGRFTRCGRAVEWPGGELTMTADTLSGCGDGAITASVDQVTLDGLRVSDNAGVAADLELSKYLTNFFVASVTNGTFRDGSGLALRLRQPSAAADGYAQVSGNRFEGNGAGADIAVRGVNVHHNVCFANAGDGLRCTPPDASAYGSIDDNTSAFNLGHGVSLQPGAGGIPSAMLVRRNLAAQNGGSGLRFGAAFAGTVANNDAWQNYGVAYSGIVAGPSNLQLDPRFCDLPNGVLTLAADSPCAPAAATGPIGALGVGCALPVAGVTPGAGLTAFAVRPSPARGSVEFVLPEGVREGRFDVLDAQGRRVWSRALGSGVASVRWQGESDGGSGVPAGLYWVRCTAGAGAAAKTGTRSLVWLR